MNYSVNVEKKTLQFRFEAGTSRGTMRERDTYILSISRKGSPEIIGLGEASPLKGLSIDYRSDFEDKLRFYAREAAFRSDLNSSSVSDFIKPAFPSIRFAFETALLDLENGGKRMIFDNDFFSKKLKIPINGLIWMGDYDLMKSRIDKKSEEGFDCLKMKIGAIDFEKELELLHYIRSQKSADELVLRVDANGAFSYSEAPEKLQRLAELDLHSIEQPIRSRQPDQMKKLCETSPVPIALDEELIGIFGKHHKAALLDHIKPAHIVLKPTLTGGLQSTAEWIELAEERNIGWWVTSALESNIGLNAIAQFTANYKPENAQGLGTGQLFHNNISMPLKLEKGHIFWEE